MSISRCGGEAHLVDPGASASSALACSTALAFSSPALKRPWVSLQDLAALGHRGVGDVAILIGEQQIDIGLGEGARQRQPRGFGVQRIGLGGVARLGDQVGLLAPEIQVPAQLAAT